MANKETQVDVAHTLLMTKIVNNMVDTCIFNHISERQVSLNKNNGSVMDCQSLTEAYEANLHNNVDAWWSVESGTEFTQQMDNGRQCRD